MERMKAYARLMESKLQKLGAEVDSILTKLEKPETESKSDYRFRIDDLKARYQIAKSKLEELKVAGSDRWEIFKGGVETAWNELEDAIKKVKN